MKKILKSHLFFAVFVALTFIGCDSEEKIPQQPFVAAFEEASHKYEDIIGEKVMYVKFSEKAQANGFVRIRMTVANATYGVDFELDTAPEGNEFELPITAGQTKIPFVFRNLVYPFDSSDKVVTFEIIEINYPFEHSIQGYTNTVVSFGRSQGGVASPEIGGPNQGDQVYVDLSTETATKVRRDSWDLGFYSGEEFRVGLNSSIYMAAKQLEATNIDEVTQASVSQYFSQVSIGTFDPDNINYVDAPSGHISGTALDPVSTVLEENHVYLVNLGYTVGTATPPIGSVAIAGNARGWKKIRVLRDAGNYVLQYADLNSNTHEEVSIQKNAAYNFTFFSFTTQTVVSVEPEKTKWDLNFTVFTNEIVGSGSYGYSDFVLNNLKAGIKLYQVNVAGSVTYDSYALSNVDDNLFVDDQRVIGADWRDVFSGTVYTNKFYVIKDSDGNYYKIRMQSFLDEIGTRGYPQFEYKLLQ